MRTAPMRLYLTIIALSAVSLVVFAVAAALEPVRAESRQLVLSALLVPMIFLARAYPVHVGPKVKISVDTAPVFATVLLLPAPLAIAVAAVAVATAGVIRRSPWFQTMFAVDETALRVAAGAGMFWLVSGETAVRDLTPGPWMLAAPVAASVMYNVNEFLIDTIVTVQRRRSPVRDFLKRRWFDLPHEATLYLLGLLVAGIGVDYPWAIGLLLAPSFVVHRSLRDSVALRAQTRDALIELADIVDMRDHYTFQHSCRVAALARATAEELALPRDEIETIEMAGRVHDVGKIGIKSTVLLNPGRLNAAQWDEMRTHPEVGAKLVAKFPQFAKGREIVLGHHERFDGSGYPNGLSGARIPLGARIIAAADAWDAMTSHRAYRSALPVELAMRELEVGRFHQFDPIVLDAFLRALARYPELAQPHTDERQAIDLPNGFRLPARGASTSP